MAKNSGQKINVPMILISAVVAALAWFLIHGLKEQLLNLGGPLGIGILSALFLIAMSVTVLLVSKMLGSYRADVVTGERKKTKFVATMLICVIACMALMFGFEWLYETDAVIAEVDTDTYIFVVDDSGSTQDTDPDQMRFKALQELIKEKGGNVQYAIYSFADDVALLQPMQKVSDGVPLVQGDSLGGTSIKAALDRVISDYEQGLWQANGGARVILITDGYATDIMQESDVDPILRRYQNNNISVSSVGLGAVDASLLNRIADRTGGEFVDISQVDQMSEAVMSAASFTKGTRDLFSEREADSGDLIRGIMRIVFVGILGVMISVAEAFAYGNNGAFWGIVVIGTIKALIASTFLELGICLLGLPASIVSLISMTVIGTVVARFAQGGSRGSSRGTSRRIDFDD